VSFWRNYYHLTWATKNRLPIIQATFDKQLYDYIVKRAMEIDVIVYAINGTEDHLHIVVAIPPKHSVAHVAKHLKGASSHYVNHVIRPGENFEWQRGYGCLTVGEKLRSIAENYVRNQKQHHAEKNTNGWLERYAEEDDGPINDEMDSGGKSGFVRDQPGNYDLLGDRPF
jgi:REP element-mobilizing transposase RayT